MCFISLGYPSNKAVFILSTSTSLCGIFLFSLYLQFLLTLGLVCAAIHLTAWNDHFFTHAKQIIWRIAACIVGSGGVAFYVIIVWEILL